MSALFVGLNHHQQVMIFGACLMYDEMIISFQWLFSNFLDCMKGKEPTTLFTDQDVAIAAAIKSKFSSTYHVLCTWHLRLNAEEHIGSISRTQEFKDHMMYLFYHVDTVEEFDIAWVPMIEECFPGVDVKSGTYWLSRFLKLREKWCSEWLKRNFTAGMTTTQHAGQ
ncbi:unnamed protein product [Linum trigynum]|uniref:MULE transposase domain-containing protein n=1 Tax=Linum trigynum TaxID=586398 RepID=A0AAV2GDN7_9ROSI